MNGWWLRILRTLRWRRAEREIDEELRFHIEMETEELRRQGLDPVEARRRARLAFGGEDRWRESVRSARGTGWIEDGARDVRFALRGLRRTPGFTAAALGTLALGIGATAAVHSVVDQVVFAPLPYAQPHELVAIWHTDAARGIEQGTTSWPNFRDWRAESTAFQGMATVVPGRRTLIGAGDPVEVQVVSVSRGFFDVMGVPPALGRAFRSEEVEGEVARAAVLSHGLFTARFGGDPAVVGRSVVLDGESFEVVGVAAPGAEYPRTADLWIPQAFGTGRQWRDPRHRLWLGVVGRLTGGADVERGQADLDGVAARLERAHPDTNAGVGVRVEPLSDALVGDLRAPFRMLLGAVLVVLALAVVNVGNLLLARGAARRREWAARLALGAGSGRVVRQALVQSAVLGVFGGLLGAAVAALGVMGLVAVAPAGLPRIDAVRVDPWIVMFAVSVGIGASAAFGVAPALSATRVDPGSSLRSGTRTVGAPGLGRLRGLFVGGQFALAFVLLVGAGLLIRSFDYLRAVDPGFDPQGVLSVRVGLPADRYAAEGARLAFHAALVRRVGALPGVAGTGTISSLFLGDAAPAGEITVEGVETSADGPEIPVVTDVVSPDLFETLAMPIVAGRNLDGRDRPEDPPAVVVNEAFARAYLRGVDPVGRRFTWGEPHGETTTWFTIVGMVADARRSGLEAPTRPAVFETTTQRPRRALELMVRTGGDPLDLVPAVRAVIHELDPLLPLTEVRSLESALGDALAQRRYVAWLLGVFAATALGLAAVGVFGVLSWIVARRTREIGIRVALGADRRRVVAGVVRDGLLHAGAGLGVGVVVSLALAGLVRSQLVGVGSTDPATFVGAAAVLLFAAATACTLPAQRAAAVDAMVALREE